MSKWTAGVAAQVSKTIQPCRTTVEQFPKILVSETLALNNQHQLTEMRSYFALESWVNHLTFGLEMV